MKGQSRRKNKMTTKRIVLKFPKTIVDQPIIYKLIKEYDLIFNIIRAEVSPEKQGLLVIELSGTSENYKKGIKYLEHLGVRIQSLSKDIVRDEKKCTDCTVCVGVCPTKALDVPNRKTMEIEFDKNKCILCDACIEACPFHALSVEF